MSDLRHTGKFLDGLRKTAKLFSHNNKIPHLDSKMVPRENKQKELPHKNFSHMSKYTFKKAGQISMDVLLAVTKST